MAVRLGGRLRYAGVLAAALAVLTPHQAAGFELFGIKFFERSVDEDADDNDVLADPQPYEVVFETVGEEELERDLKRASALWRERSKPASATAGLVARANGDYGRILSALYAKGYYGGAIYIRIDGREATQIAINEFLPDPVDVRIRVETGPLFKFNQANIANKAPPPVERGDFVEDPADEGFARGEEARSTAIVKAGRLAVEAWREQGRPLAKSERDVVADHRDRTVDANLTVDPGPRAGYAPVVVEGTSRMIPSFVAKQTGLKPGEEYDPDDIKRAEERLLRLNVFRSTRIVEGKTVGDDGLLPITVNVQERKLRRVGIGATYSTLDGLGVETFWLHRNLFGRAERLRFDARVGGVGADVDPEDYDYLLGVTFTKPGIFTPDTDLEASLRAERVNLDVYSKDSVKGLLGFDHIFNEFLTGSLDIAAEQARYEDDFGIRDFTTLGLAGDLTYDTRDNELDPTRGFYVNFAAEPFYEFQYENAALRAEAEGRAYLAFGADDDYVLAGRLKIGSIVGPEVEQLPPDKLFFSGGGGSVRGYEFRSISVLRDDGIETGGRSLIETSAELRARFARNFGAVAFVDAGYVGAESSPDFSEDLRIGAGLGFRYYTPIGPLRFDVAIPLDPRDDDPDYAFYIGIGQAF